MSKRSFAKGIHPHDHKAATAPLATETLAAPIQAIIPLHQHAGAPAQALVKKGDRVLVGQMLGAAAGAISAAVHASVAGTVKAIETRPIPGGANGLCVIIDNDGSDETAAPPHALKAACTEYGADEIRQAVRWAGIVGMGGAAFPSAVKLSPPKETPVDTVVINGAECEPYLTTDYRLMLEQPEAMLDGADAIRRTVGAREVVIGIEDNKPEAIQRLNALVTRHPAMRVVALKTKYPQGGEKMLVKALLNRKVPAGGLPFQVGVVVQNVATCVAIHDTLIKGRPLISRGLTVCGAVHQPKNLHVRIGTPFREVLAACGGARADIGKLIMGGPLMGVAQWSDDIPVVKATSGILLLPQAQAPREYPCIRCNRCTDHCPMLLVPTRLAAMAKLGEWEEIKQWHITDCMECGTCAYACPAHIPLVQWIRLGKQEVHKRRSSAEKK